jgi:hypothetical protein
VTLRRLAALQWIALLAGAGMWAAGFVAGWGITEAECRAGGARWGIENDPWQAVVMTLAALSAIAAGSAGIVVTLRTRGVSYSADPPLARIRFFAIAALVANLLFLMIVLLSGLSAIVNTVCRQA